LVALSLFATRSNRALIATITVLNDIGKAPIAGDNRIPAQYKAPAAKGMKRVNLYFI